MLGAKMDYRIELVARAFHDAEYEGLSWDQEPEILKRQFREYARNAINLLDEDIGVLLLALEQATDPRPGEARAAA
jgi:hypothetical protein